MCLIGVQLNAAEGKYWVKMIDLNGLRTATENNSKEELIRILGTIPQNKWKKQIDEARLDDVSYYLVKLTNS